MKKSIFLLFAAFATLLVGCQREEIDGGQGQQQQQQEQQEQEQEKEQGSLKVMSEGIWYNLTPKDKQAEVTSSDGTEYSGSITLPATVTHNGKKYSVTSIGNCAFFGCSSLTSITLPKGVTSIGGSAFSDCSRLTAITLPESVTSIGDYAFYDCSSLASITIPESIEEIGYDAFYGTAWLNNQPDGVLYIGKMLYRYVGTMPTNTSVEVRKGTVSIGSSAFYECSSLTAITIPEGVTSIGYDAFFGCSSLTAITIPGGVTSIGSCAFCECSSLTAITLPKGVTSIGGSAFSFCSRLTAITLPESVTSIGDYAFSDCSRLKSVKILAVTPPGIGYDTFYGIASGATLYVPKEAVSTYRSTNPWNNFSSINSL